MLFLEPQSEASLFHFLPWQATTGIVLLVYAGFMKLAGFSKLAGCGLLMLLLLGLYRLGDSGTFL